MDGFLPCASRFFEEPDLDSSQARTLITKLEILETENRSLELDLIDQQEAFQHTILGIEDEVSQLKHLVFKLEKIIDDSSKSREPVFLDDQSLQSSTVDPCSFIHKNEEPNEGDTDRYISHKLQNSNLDSIGQVISKAQDLKELLFKTTDKLLKQQNKFQELNALYRTMATSEEANQLLEEKNKELNCLLSEAGRRQEGEKQRYKAKIRELREIGDRTSEENRNLSSEIEAIREELYQVQVANMELEENNSRLKLKMNRKISEAENKLMVMEQEAIGRLNNSEDQIRLLRRENKRLRKDVGCKNKIIQEYSEVSSNTNTLNEFIKSKLDMNSSQKRYGHDLVNKDAIEESLGMASINSEADEKERSYDTSSGISDTGYQMQLDFQNVVMQNNVLLVNKLNSFNVFYK